jgi:hypothetical protein
MRHDVFTEARRPGARFRQEVQMKRKTIVAGFSAALAAVAVIAVMPSAHANEPPSVPAPSLSAPQPSPYRHGRVDINIPGRSRLG